MRSAPQPRDQRPAGRTALQNATQHPDPRVWFAVALMVRSGQRIRDATWVAGGWCVDGSVYLTRSAFTAQPEAEKTDTKMSRVPLPVVLVLEELDYERLA